MKKGFTLIELLAVILLLGIVATITTPIILSVISDSKENSSISSARMYANVLDADIINLKVKGYYIRDGIYFINSDGNLCLIGINSDLSCKRGLLINGGSLNIGIQNDRPSCGEIVIKNGEVDNIYDLQYSNYSISIDSSRKNFNVENVNGCKVDPKDSCYTKNNSSYTAYNCDNKYIYVGDGSISKIGSSTFKGKGLKSVTLDYYITTIESNAFEDNNLTRLYVPISIKTIGSYAFSNNNIKELYIGNYDSGDTSLRDDDTNLSVFNSKNKKVDASLLAMVVTPSTLTIGDYAFYNNDLTSVTIYSNVSSIGSNAFYNNPNLKEVVIYACEGDVTIGENAFPPGTSISYKKDTCAIPSV